MAAEAPPATKLQEQATGKADLSYSWWASNTVAQAGTSLPAPPKKLTEEEALEIERQSSAQGASAWNHAGTFEEKSVGEWARQWIKGNLVDLRQGSVRVTEVTSVEGDANIWFVRGKRRHGFDFSIKMQWKSSSSSSTGGTEVTGTIKIPNACLDDMDELFAEVEVVNKKADQAVAEAAAVKEATALTAAVQTRLTKFLAELKLKQ